MRKWNRVLRVFVVLCLAVVPGSVLAQATLFRSRVVTRTDRNGRVVSGVERVRVVGQRGATGLGRRSSASGATSGQTLRGAMGNAAGTNAGRLQPKPNGGPGVTINAASFAAVAVGSSSSMTLVFDASAGALTFTSGFGPDYSISSTSCDTSCNVQVVFSPLYPGSRSSVVTATNSSGAVVAETFVYGTGTGPQVGFELGYATIFESGPSSGIQQPTGITLGPDRTAYITDAASKQVYTINRYDANNPNDVMTLGIANLGSPSGIAVGADGTVYVADTANNVIVSDTAAGAQGRVATSPLSGPTGLAVDGTGALYIADTGNGRVIRIDNQGVETTLASALTSPQGIAVDSAGDVFFNNNDATSGGTIVELPAGGGPAQHFGSGLGAVQALALDAGGTLYYSTPALLGLLTTAGGLTIYNYGSNGPTGIAVGPNGDLYTALGMAGEFDTTDRSSGNVVLNAAVGGSAQAGLTLRNTGNAALMLTNVATSEPSIYTLDSASVCAANDVVNPAATCEATVDYNPVTPGPDPQTVNVTSNSLNLDEVVNRFIVSGYAGQTGTSLTVSDSSVASGQPVTLTALVYPQEGSDYPTGMVQFVDYDTVIGTATLAQSSGISSQSVATFTTSSLSAGTHFIVAMYLGSDTQAGSSSDAQMVMVTGGVGTTTSTTLGVSAASVSAGATETLTATIAGGSSPAVSGMVSFFDQNGMLGSATVTATGTGGTAVLALTTLSTGSHSIDAMYGGDDTYNASTSGTQTVMVTAATAGTTTSLTVDRSSVAYRTPVAFTAAVATTAGAPVTAGQVIFCDAAATYCSRNQNLAIAQLNGSGVAVTRMAAGVVGDHVFRAVFLGTSGVAGSASTSQNVAVTTPSSYAVFATIGSTGSVGNYTLTGSVTGLGTRLLAPSGTVTFNDTTNTSNPVLGTATLGAATLGFLALQPSGSPVAVGTHPYGVAAGDFNGDGYPDVVTENYNGGTVSVLLGLGNGSFRPAVSYAVGSLPERVLVADFNGDGNLDLVVANTGSGTVSVLLGNGDGTFRGQVTYACSSPVGLGVMDLNHDGFADIVAGDYYSNTVSVLLGNGDGTFRTAVTYATGSTPQTLAEGDFNGDGNVDLAVGNEGGRTVGILLGNGDGTFRAQVTYAVGDQPQGVQVGDFNRDGFDDLAVSNSGDGTISVLLGNGDGTFRPQVTYPVGGQPVGLAIADFNGDGYLDLSVGNTAQASLTQSILLGNGDGTFQPQKVFPTGNFPYGEAVADFDGNGFPDLAIANFSDNTATILLSYATQTATATITGVSPSGAAGAHNVDASYAGDGNFGAYTSSTIPLTVAAPAPATSATSLTIRPAAATIGQSVGFFVSVVGTTQTYPAATGTVTLMNTSVGPAAVLGVITLGSTGGGSFSTSSLVPGTYSVTATYSGDAAYAPSTSAAQTLVVSQAGTTTTLTVSAATVTVGQAETLNVSVQGSAGVALSGTVTFLDGTTVLGSSAVVLASSGGSTAFATASLSLSSLGAGLHSIAARYSGDANYTASQGAAQTVTVAQATAPVSLAVSAASLPVGQAEMLTATVQHAGAPALSGTVMFFDGTALLGTSTVTATSSGGTAALTVSTLAVGPHQVVARYSGDMNYAASVSGPQAVVVSLVAQTIAFPAIANHQAGDSAFLLNATASSGLAVAYAVVSGPATVFGSSVTVTGAGTVVIQASQAGNATYAAATPVTQSFTVTAQPVVTLAAVSPASAVVGAAATTVTLTGTNFAARDAVQMNGATIGSTFVNATTLTAVVPASSLLTAGTRQITVVDPQSATPSGAVAFAVVAVPAVVFSGPSASTSAQQPALTLQLVNPYPTAITGTLTLTFAPSSAGGVDDPAVQFATGGRTFLFTIPANSTATPAVLLQTGTVAGTATATLVLTANGLNVTPASAAPVVIAIATAAPSIATAAVTRGTNTLTVVVHGFSNTREITTAVFHFVAAAGSTIDDPDVTVNVGTEFAQWYGSAASTQYGSSFTYMQQFTLDKDASSVGSVTVTLMNSVGTSAAGHAQ